MDTLAPNLPLKKFGENAISTWRCVRLVVHFLSFLSSFIAPNFHSFNHFNFRSNQRRKVDMKNSGLPINILLAVMIRARTLRCWTKNCARLRAILEQPTVYFTWHCLPLFSSLWLFISATPAWVISEFIIHTLNFNRNFTKKLLLFCYDCFLGDGLELSLKSHLAKIVLALKSSLIILPHSSKKSKSIVLIIILAKRWCRILWA